MLVDSCILGIYNYLQSKEGGKLKRLPDAEFEVMKVAWSVDKPVTASKIIQKLGNKKGWRRQTAITLLLRLTEKGFLLTEKNGTDRFFYPIIQKETYLQVETKKFLKEYHENSFLKLFNALYGDKKLSETETEEILDLLNERRENKSG